LPLTFECIADRCSSVDNTIPYLPSSVSNIISKIIQSNIAEAAKTTIKNAEKLFGKFGGKFQFGFGGIIGKFGGGAINFGSKIGNRLNNFGNVSKCKLK
jgi:hypothetical protein